MPRHGAITPITLGNMRANGVRSAGFTVAENFAVSARWLRLKLPGANIERKPSEIFSWALLFPAKVVREPGESRHGVLNDAALASTFGARPYHRAEVYCDTSQ